MMDAFNSTALLDDSETDQHAQCPNCPLCGETLLVLTGLVRCPRCGLMLCQSCDGSGGS